MSSSTSPDHSDNRTKYEGYCFSLVICRHPVTKKYLAVEENKNRGWWIPAGAVDAGETFGQAAVRECQEEAGVAIYLKGILKIERNMMETQAQGAGNNTGDHFFKMRIVYYAEPRDVNNCEPKQVADRESVQAQWLTLEEFEGKEKMRGDDLLYYGEKIERKGIEKCVYPLSMLEETFESGRKYF